MKRMPGSVLATLALITVNAVFWMGFAVMAALGALPGFEEAGAVRWILAGLALGASICLGGLAFFLSKRNQFAFYVGVILLAAIAILSITDQFVLYDLLTLLSILAALVLLIKDRTWYLQGRAGENMTNGK